VFWGEVTRAVRTPSRVDEDISVALFAAPTAPPLYAVISGNKDLDTERVIGAEVGYRALLRSNFYVDVTTFHNDYANLLDLGRGPIETRQTDGITYTAFLFPWVDAIDGTTRGVELAPDWQLSSRLRLRGSYSFVSIELAEDARGSQTLLPALEGSTPRHQVVLQGLANPVGPLQVDPIYRYVSARRAPSVPAYHALDVHVAWPFASGLELSVVGQNLLQAHHVEWTRDPGPAVAIRRAALVSLTWRH
jgi:iron complex outermembrane receptor protein